MHILIIGAGRLGLSLGYLLRQAGRQVSLLGREATLYPGGVPLPFDGLYGSVEAARSSGPYDLILLCVQSYDTVPLIFEMEVAGGLPAPLITLQRGLGNLESLDSAFGAERIGAAALLPPGSLAAGAPKLLLPSGREMARLIESAFPADIIHHTTVSKRELKWIETLPLLVADALPAILDRHPPSILADATLCAIEEAVIREAAAIMRLDGVEPLNLPGLPAARLERASQARRGLFSPALPRLMAGQLEPESRSQRALRQGSRRLEAAWTYGGVAQAADRLKRYAPLNHALALTLNDLAAGRIDAAAYRSNPELLMSSLRAAQRLDLRE